MLAIATESLIKLLAFLIVGTYVTFFLFSGPADLISRAGQQLEILPVFTKSLDPTTWVTMTVLSFVCIVLLPRQFHVTVVENNGASEMRRAAWLFRSISSSSIFVVPIAIAGLTCFRPARWTATCTCWCCC
jgi:Na+/proline symporter